jgi:hypothetical protein
MAGKRLALLIANANYEHSELRKLNAPTHDVEALGELLTRSDIGGYEGQVLIDGTKGTIERAIDRMLTKGERDDTALIFFAGHGLKHANGKLYFAAQDTEPDYLGATAVSASWLMEQMQNSRVGSQIVLLDCCFGGAFARGMVRRGEKVESGRALEVPGLALEGRGQVVITSADAMQFAFEEGAFKEGQSPASNFVRALTDGLRTGEADSNPQDGRITIDELVNYLVRKMKIMGSGQTPTKWSFGVTEGDLLFARNPLAKAAAKRTFSSAKPISAYSSTPKGEEYALPDFDASVFDDILSYAEERSVVPIIGSDLLAVENKGEGALLYQWLAKELAGKLSLPLETLPPSPRLNDVVTEFVGRGGPQQRIYARLLDILRESQFTPPASLMQLAEISDLDLFVTLTFDSLLAQALNSTRFAGEKRTVSLACKPFEIDDLPIETPTGKDPTVYHLLGKLSAAPYFAVSDEEIANFFEQIRDRDRRPGRLFDAIKNRHLIVVGSGLPEWLFRLLLSLLESGQMPRQTLRILVDDTILNSKELSRSLAKNSGTILFPGGPSDFVSELWRRWRTKHQTASGSEMPEGAILISCPKGDVEVAQKIIAALKAAGLIAWLGNAEIGAGENVLRAAKINVHRCSAFVPVISRNAEQVEGFFRYEWRHAIERSKGMMDNIQFIVPVATDDTSYDMPGVPEEFRTRMWARLPGGQVTAEFVAQLRQIVDDYEVRRRA